MGAFGADVTSPFVPVGVTPNYPPPRAHIAPEKEGRSWIHRMMPIVLAHKPGTKVTITYTDTSGQSQTATVTLGSGPPQ